MAQISTNEYNSIRQQILSKANRRANEETLNHPFNHPQMSGGDMNDDDMVGGAKVMAMGEQLGKSIGDDMKEMVGAGFFDDFKKGFVKGLKMIGTPVKKIAKAVGKSVPEARIAGDVLEAIGLGRRKAKKPMKSTDKRKLRGAMISKLMKSKGMTLGEASKHIKENNLI